MPNDEKNEKLKYLKREEVRTMAKDLAKLHELAAQKERERIAKIKIAEEVEKEKVRQELASHEAETRKKLEEQASQREEAIKKAREERLKIGAEEVGPPEEVGPQKESQMEFKEQLKETQSKEEAARRQFLEKIETLAEQQPVRPTVPPIAPPALKQPASQTILPAKPTPQKQSIRKKILIRAILSLFIFSLLALLATFWYWYLAVRPERVLPPEEKEEEVVISPEELLAGMSLEEKVGQLFIIGIEPQDLTPALKSIFEELSPGGIILFSKNIANENQVKKLINDLQDLSSLPLFVAIDQEGGIISRIPFLNEQTSQVEINNEAQAFQVGLERGRELKALGFNLNLAPVLDQLNPDDFLYQRGFQRNAETIGKLGKAIVEGQKEAGILTAIKHFPGYTGVTFNPEEILARLPIVPEISQFKKAIEAKPEFVMTSNAIVTELNPVRRFMFSQPDIKFLRDSLPGNYLIITDDLSQNVLLQKFSLEDILTTPINAGVDILLFSDYRESPEKAIKAFLGAVKDNKISREIIDQTVLKIIKLKQKLR